MGCAKSSLYTRWPQCKGPSRRRKTFWEERMFETSQRQVRTFLSRDKLRTCIRRERRCEEGCGGEGSRETKMIVRDKCFASKPADRTKNLSSLDHRLNAVKKNRQATMPIKQIKATPAFSCAPFYWYGSENVIYVRSLHLSQMSFARYGLCL